MAATSFKPRRCISTHYDFSSICSTIFAYTHNETKVRWPHKLISVFQIMKLSFSS